MGCWFACLRFRAERTPLSSVESTPCKSSDRLVSRNQLAAVLSPEVKGSPCKGDAVLDGVSGELRHEAKFLKACGALLETPAELIKMPQKTSIQNSKQDDLAYTSHFSLPDSCCKKFQWDEQLDEFPLSSTSGPKRCLLDNTYDISISEKQQCVRTYNNTVQPSTPVSLTISSEIRTKSVRFKVVRDEHGVESDAETVSKATPQEGSHIHSLASKYSPYPTPLKLTDEMETPGTVYPAKMENCGLGNSTWIRSQYVYPVLKPISNQPKWKATSEVSHLCPSSETLEQQIGGANSPVGEAKLKSSLSSFSVDSGSPQSDKHLCLEDTHANRETSTMSTVGSDDGQSPNREEAKVSAGCPMIVVSSLSQWTECSNQSDERVNKETGARRSPASKSPERDRPIIGMVAAHWNSEESTRTSPKLWDGKGIPNSTNKYKEDQRVSWHATPFEERLEKALSDEKLYPQRNLPNGELTDLDEEEEEGDTATS